MSATKPLTQEELDDKLCETCERTDYGAVKVNSGPHNLCEGCRCDQAYECYLEDFRPEFDDETEEFIKVNLIEFDKVQMKEELTSNPIPQYRPETWVEKYTYYRMFGNNLKMFYSTEYLLNHTVKELEDNFKKWGH